MSRQSYAGMPAFECNNTNMEDDESNVFDHAPPDDEFLRKMSIRSINVSQHMVNL
jgi:hypothetical protein